MREILFRLLAEQPGHFEAQACDLPLRIAAASLEELQHEAREALIEHFGPVHCAYRVRICPSQRSGPVRRSLTQPYGSPPLSTAQR
jgi:hypothetical protein